MSNSFLSISQNKYEAEPICQFIFRNSKLYGSAIFIPKTTLCVTYAVLWMQGQAIM